MKRSGLSKFVVASVLALSAAIVHLALPASVQAEAPPGESYNPRTQAGGNTSTVPTQGSYDVQSDRHHTLGWLGLIGLAGLAGLVRR